MIHVLHTFANNSSVPYLSWFAARAKKEGSVRYTFLIMHAERPAMFEEMRALGFEVIWIRFEDERRKSGMLRALPILWWHIRRLRPDIVHCNLFDDSLPGLMAAWLAGARVRVLTKQDTGFHWIFAPRWVALDRWNNRMASSIIAISRENERFILENEGAPAEKVTLVHNGIPPEQFTRRSAKVMDEMRNNYGIQGDSLVIGTVARMIGWKGHDHIIGAAKRFVLDHPNALFLFCGQGEREQHLRRSVLDAGLQDHIVFTGRIPPERIPSFYGILDIYLHAAMMEPFGLVYAEAMMNGVPVVSTTTGAAADVIRDEENGILVQRPDAEDLYLGLGRLMKLDRRAIGEAGKATAMQAFRFDVMWQGTMEVYQRALARS